ncbi:MAG: LVIVD repeat-containing protein [Chitinophagales bacterium]
MNFQKLFIGFSVLVFIFAACDKENGSAAEANSIGTGGSLARFTISGNYLYLADRNSLKVFDISNASNPIPKPEVPIGFGVETIFPYKDKLFIGSMQGMFIYSLTNPAAPAKLGSAIHLRSCDPVIANDSVSYSTLQGGSPCGPAESGLYIYDIKDITTPVLKKLLPLSTPFGLGLKDSVVFVCRGSNGLSAIKVKDPFNPVVLYTKTDATYMDVIPYDNMLICYVRTGIIIYDASNPVNIVKVGTVNY